MSKVEFKGCSGGLLMLDGQLSEAGEAFFKSRGDPIEFKVVTPESLRTNSAHVQRVRGRMAEIQQSLDAMKHTPASNPVVIRALARLNKLAAEGRAPRGAANRT